MSSSVPKYAGRIVKRSGTQAEGAGPAASGASRYHGEDAAAIIAEAHREADQIRAERLEQLEAECQQRVAQEVARAMRSVNLAIGTVSEDLAGIIRQGVEKIIGQAPPDTLLEMVVTQAINQLTEKHQVSILASPADFPRLEAFRMKAGLYDQADWLKIVHDPALPPGRCIMCAGERRFDISVEAQLEALQRALLTGDNNRKLWAVA
jgi:flagellar biosynthesis/type III secretory pathway protein FliH